MTNTPKHTSSWVAQEPGFINPTMSDVENPRSEVTRIEDLRHTHVSLEWFLDVCAGSVLSCTTTTEPNAAAPRGNAMQASFDRTLSNYMNEIPDLLVATAQHTLLPAVKASKCRRKSFQRRWKHEIQIAPPCRPRPRGLRD